MSYIWSSSFTHFSRTTVIFAAYDKADSILSRKSAIELYANLLFDQANQGLHRKSFRQESLHEKDNGGIWLEAFQKRRQKFIPLAEVQNRVIEKIVIHFLHADG